ncbi:hypothetical protein ACUXOM_002220 [Staphylococcus epidermidis]
MRKLNEKEVSNINGGKSVKQCLTELGFTVAGDAVTGATGSALASLGVGALGGAVIGANVGLVAGAVGCAQD